jgi:hypothetical protein
LLRRLDGADHLEVLVDEDVVMTVLPGSNGPVLTETACSKRPRVPGIGVPPVKTHMSVLGQATTAGSRFRPSVRFDHVAAGAPGGPAVGAVAGVVVIGVSSVVVVVELLTVVVVIACFTAAEPCVRAAWWGLCATPTPAAASEVMASTDIGVSRQRLETNRVTTPMRPLKCRDD